MTKDLIEKLACPVDKHELDLKIFATDTEGRIVEGLFTCPHCGRYYPIIYGIPVFTPDEYREHALEAPVLQRWEKQLPGTVATSDFLLLPEGK